MKRNISDFIIVSDLDGTLLTSDYKTSQRNLDAVARFKQNGGRFTLATGRSIDSARAYVNMFNIDIPVIVCNGGMIYDYKAEKVIYSENLPSTANGYVKELCEKFPEAGAEAIVEDIIYIVSSNDYIEKHVRLEPIKFEHADFDNVPKTWTKAIFAADEKVIGQMQKYFYEQSHKDVYLVKSSDIYLEMLPLNISKASALKELSKILNQDLQNFAAIGDFYNDVEMLKAAGISAAPSTAPAEIRKVASKIVCSCGEGAVADLIEYLETLCK